MKTSLPVVTLMGPTASGKTGLAIALAKQVNGEVVSVDSALIYRDMDIGTAKPSMQERDGIAHWLIDTHDPAESYSVSAFFDDVVNCVNDITSRGKIPILTGGTMMYFNALTQGISQLPHASPAVRQQIEEEASIKGWAALHTELASVDTVCAARIHPNDPQRVTRALEVYRSTGKPLSWWQTESCRKAPFNMTQFAIAPQERAVLHERISLRFNAMIEQGFVEEVEKLFARKDLHKDLASMRSVGYRQMWEYLEGTLDFTSAREKSVIATRQLAKRQLTWLRKWNEVDWLDTFAHDNVKKMLAKIEL